MDPKHSVINELSCTIFIYLEICVEECLTLQG